MELKQGILRGLSSFKDGESKSLLCQVDPHEFAQLPASAKALGELTFQLEVQMLSHEYVLTVSQVLLQIQAPCCSCARTLSRSLKGSLEHLAFEFSEVRSGEMDLRQYIRDLVTSLVPDCLPCDQNPCEWREELDLQMNRQEKEKPSHAFHPFKSLLSKIKSKMSQE